MELGSLFPELDTVVGGRHDMLRVEALPEDDDLQTPTEEHLVLPQENSKDKKSSTRAWLSALDHNTRTDCR